MNYKKTKGFDVIEAKGNFKQAEAMPEEANRRSIGGFSDWVFPDMKTLLGLQKISPFKGWVWSSSPYMGFGSGAWVVDFNVGDICSSYHLGKGHVRLVRASQSLSLVMEQPAPLQQEPCGWQFFQDGKWHDGMETNKHRVNTEAAGVPVRDVYPPPQAQPSRDYFLKGICVALQCVKDHGDGVLWKEIVHAAGADELFQYAAHTEPEEWNFAGFDVFAYEEMRRKKPKKLAARPTQN